MQLQNLVILHYTYMHEINIEGRITAYTVRKNNLYTTAYACEHLTTS